MWYNPSMLNERTQEIVKSCLWGSDLKSLDLEADKFLIAERLLEHGGDRQVKFILDNYSRKNIVQVIKESSYLSRKTVNYWCLVLNIKKEETRCYTKPSLIPWPPS